MKLQSPISLASKPKQANGNGAAQVNPRKVPATSGYEAQGLVKTPPLDVELGSSIPTRILEQVPELVTQYQRTLTYARMMNDAGVDASMRVVKTPVLGAEIFVEPYSSDPQDLFIAEFIQDNFFGGLSAPLTNSMIDILKFFEDGYSVLTEVYEQRSWSPSAKGANAKTYTMLKKLGARPASTISEILYDNNGGPASIKQNAIQADGSVVEVDLDIFNTLIFTFNRQGGDLTGKSLLRTAYPHWYYKTHFYKIDAVQKERHSIGVPRGKLLPGYKPSDRNIMRTLLRNLRTNQEAFIIQTPNVEIDFAELKAMLVNPLDSATHHNMMIMFNVLAQFLMMGVEHGSGGGRATSGTSADIYMKSLKYVANYIVDMLNMYTIPKLVVWNFPSRNFPKLKVRSIGETRDLQMFASAVSNLLAQGGITMDDPTENWLRQQMDMPMMDPSTKRAPVDATSNATNTATPVKPQKGSTKQPAGSGGNMGKPPSATQ